MFVYFPIFSGGFLSFSEDSDAQNFPLDNIICLQIKNYYFSMSDKIYVMFCSVWYLLYNLKNVKNTHGVVLLLVKLQAKSKFPPCVFYRVFKLYKWR